MKKLKKMVISLLCEVGKNGVEKSPLLGMYEIKVPIELLKDPQGVGDKISKYKN